MRHVRILAVATLALTSMLTSCGPIYDTEYVFTPPDGSQGRVCIYQCENSRDQCRQLEEYKSSDCEQRSEWKKARCEADIWRRKNREPKWYECGGESCSSNTERCDTNYRSCYQACGGDVRAETRCVANCDQIPPQQQPNYAPQQNSSPPAEEKEQRRAEEEEQGQRDVPAVSVSSAVGYVKIATFPRRRSCTQKGLGGGAASVHNSPRRFIL